MVKSVFYSEDGMNSFLKIAQKGGNLTFYDTFPLFRAICKFCSMKGILELFAKSFRKQ